MPLTYRSLPLFIACALCATAALAQSAGTDSSTAPKKKATTLKGVQVSAAGATGFAANKVEVGPFQGQDILNVPATVNVVTRELLDAQGANGLYDALRNVAGVSRQQLNGLSYDNLSVRGIALDNRSSYYFNGVLPFDNNITIPMEDKESFEVLKGASALYYGFAVPAGIVNMVTKRAGATPVTRVGVAIDNYGSAKASVDIGRRFGSHGQFGVRVNAASQHVRTPIDRVNGYRRMGSVALDWQVSSSFSLKYDYEHVEQKLPEQAGITPLAAVDGHVALPRLPDSKNLLSVADDPTKSRADTHLLRADFTLGDRWSGMVSVGQSTTRRDRWTWIFRNYDLATGQGQVQGSKQNGQVYQNRNGRAELYGELDTGPVVHQLTVGYTRNRLYQPDFTTYYFVAPQNLYAPVELRTLKPSGTPKAFYAQTVWTGGTYAFDRMSLDRWELTLGLRRSSYSSSQFGTPDDDVKKNTPSGSLVYKLDASTSLYASYIEGLESAGNAPDTAVNAGQALPAAVSKQRELGIRKRFAGDTLVSLAYFDIKQPSANLDADDVYRLDGRARYRGLEFSAQGRVLPQLSLAASAMWLHARQVESIDPTLVGKAPENTPRATASVFGEYDLAAIPGLSLNAGAFYTARRAINNADQAWIGGYTLFTAGWRYRTRIDGRPVLFQLNVDNLADKHYWSAAGSNQLAVGLGRTAMLSTTVDF
jgi:iron complex outermembrane receptor protein